MKKWIRWQGLLTLIALAFILLAIWYFFADNLVKRKVEQYGSIIAGAKVELDGVDLSLIPIGLDFSGLRIVNPDKPMTNAVDIKQIICSLDGLRLLMGKVIVEEMTLDGVQLDTPRKTSGVISTKTVVSKKQKNEKFKFPSLGKIPDVQEILEKENLKSLKLIQTAHTDVNAQEEKWRNQIKTLPDKKKFYDYKQRIEKLASAPAGGLTGVFAKARETLGVKKELSRDIDRIKSARKELEGDLKLLRKRVIEAQSAPYDDIRRLKEKYSLSLKGAANMSGLLFGEKIGERIETSFRLYRRIKPFLEGEKIGKKRMSEKPAERGKGVNVRFEENTLLPDFLVRRVRISSIETKVGILSGSIQNITTDQNILGAPLTFDFAGKEIKNARLLKLDGSLDHRNPSNAKDRINYRLLGYRAQDIILNARQPVALKKGLADIDLSAYLDKEALVANVNTDVTAAEISFGGPDEADPLVKSIGSLLSDISQFTLAANITGTPDDYDIRFFSNLDHILADAVGRQAEKQAERLEKKLRPAIIKKVDGPMDELKKSFGDLESIDQILVDHLRKAKGLL
jgi:uncharacterized protein (TIGR03545 family)